MIVKLSTSWSNQTKLTKLIGGCLLILISGVSAQARQSEKTYQDQLPHLGTTGVTSIKGQWQVVKYERFGKLQLDDANTRYLFKDGRLTVETNSQPSADLRYIVRKGQKPFQLDLILNTEDGQQVSPMIFKFEGKELVVCYAQPGLPRPDKFVADATTPNTLIHMRRLGEN